jgi:hypothetical protein
VAACDFDGDVRDEIVTAPGPGGGPHVRVFQLDTAGNLTGELAGFFAYHPAFTGGVFVACGDVDGNGASEIITGADAGGGPHVRVWTGTGADTGLSFFAESPSFTGGVRVAAGQVNGMGFGDIVTGAGPGNGPHVGVFTRTGIPMTSGFLAY